MAERTMTQRELNRAVLARQSLMKRSAQSALEVVRQLVALQGQNSDAPYIGLWTRLASFRREALTELLERRQAVRASSLRGTLHIMAADDYLWIHALLQAPLSRNLALFAERTEGFDMDRFLAEMRAFVQAQPRTAAELRAKMEELSPGMGRPNIADSVRMQLALIQIPPAGTWGFTGKPAHTAATAWLGRPLEDRDGSPQRVVRRFLAAFGPASVSDMQKWSGLTRIQAVVQEMRPELLAFRDEQGRELLDLPEAPRPPAETPAPVRFLPEFDNLLLAYADRGRIMADSHTPAVFPDNSIIAATFLVDGYVAGTWKAERSQGATSLVISPFEAMPDHLSDELRTEGEHLARWMYDGAAAVEIRSRP